MNEGMSLYISGNVPKKSAVMVQELMSQMQSMYSGEMEYRPVRVFLL